MSLCSFVRFFTSHLSTSQVSLFSLPLFGCPAFRTGRPGFRAGGDDGIRTHDPLLAGQVLSQLSYTPVSFPYGVMEESLPLSILFLKSRVITPLLSVSIELSSRTVARKVFSPLQSLTSVFGMGTGGPSAFVTLTVNFSQGSILEN